MKKIKLKYVGNFEGFDVKHNLIYDVLTDRGYDVEICDDADYVICDVFGENPYEFCKFPQIRIMYNGENYIPDFNLIDYAICSYPIQFQDRCFHLPACVWPKEHWLALPDKDRNYTNELLERKEYFACFISSHESEYNIRGDFFRKLSEYKRVEAPGTYLNNMPNGETVSWMDESKANFQKKCKFTLCFESTSHRGFVTEKLMDAFYSDSIPVYYGDPDATVIFNKNAFINCTDYESFEAVIDKIRELDQDDEKYMEMMRQPILVDPEYPARVFREMEDYICGIFDQPLEKAYRRSRVYHPKRFDDYLARAVDPKKNTLQNLKKILKEKIRSH